MRIIYKVFAPSRTVFLTGFLTLSLLFIPSASRAEDVFTVSGVKVDVKAENAVAAREKAFASAQTVAFTALAVRLLGEDEAKVYKIPDPAVISAMIKDFEITNERLSAVEYIGTYTFRFEGAAVRNRFNMQGLKYNAASARPVLVLPFLQTGQTLALWTEDNAWRKAWKRNPSRGGLTPLTVPQGDAQDVAAIHDDQALTYDHDSLSGMISRYNAGEAAVLIARPGPLDAGNVPVDLSVMIYHTGQGGPEFVQTMKILPDAGSMADALYDKAVRQVRAALQKNGKNQVAGYAPAPLPENGGAMPPGDRFDPVQTNVPVSAPYPPGAGYPPSGGALTVHVQFATMQEWIATRQALQSVPGITGLKVRSVTPREAQVDLGFAGTIDTLRAALAQNDMTLTPPPGAAAPGDSAGRAYSLSLRRRAF